MYLPFLPFSTLFAHMSPLIQPHDWVLSPSITRCYHELLNDWVLKTFALLNNILGIKTYTDKGIYATYFILPKYDSENI